MIAEIESTDATTTWAASPSSRATQESEHAKVSALRRSSFPPSRKRRARARELEQTLSEELSEELSKALPKRRRTSLTTREEEERAALRAEHADLVLKQLDEELTPREKKRLRYVRWLLDRYREVEVGAGLDRLEELAALSERAAARFQRFQQEVASLAKGQPRRREQPLRRRRRRQR